MDAVAGSIELKTPKEIGWMREAGQIVARTLSLLEASMQPGMSTWDLDQIARQELEKSGAKAAFLRYRGYPAVLCVSVNDEVVHGIPRKDKIIREGDIVSLDFGAVVNGFYGDAAITVGVGAISEKARELMKITETALVKGIAAARHGGRIGDISNAVQTYAESFGKSVVREFIGHGIGRRLHEDPAVPNYGPSGQGPRLAAGMTLAIEPMINDGGSSVRILEDQWTAVTADGSLSAHFEHTIVLTESGPEVLTKRYAEK